MIFLILEIDMPIPIKPINESQENNMYLDYSFLANQVVKNEKKVVTASNNDADLLMKIWLDAKNENNKYKISSDLGLTSRDIMRLKTYGLVKGSSNEEVEITERGKRVITVMALGEGNKFEKGKSDKNYLEILASMDKRGKDGYRLPKFCSNNSNNIDLRDATKNK